MNEPVSHDQGEGELSKQNINNLQSFNDLTAFAKAATSATGTEFDFASVIELQTNFVQGTPEYLILNVKEYGAQSRNNLLFLSDDRSYIFSDRLPFLDRTKEFEDILDKPFGRSTALCFLTLSQVLENHKNYFEKLLEDIRKLEEHFDHAGYRGVSAEFQRFGDRLEEFHELLILLQERRYKQVETQHISFDYRVLIAESLSLQGRCRRRFSSLRELRQDHEMEATEELNRRIVKLNDVVKRLTAITVILMLPTLIASHFGMNFQYMPELHVWWAYPAVVGVQLVIMGVFALIFRRIGWI